MTVVVCKCGWKWFWFYIDSHENFWINDCVKKERKKSKTIYIVFFSTPVTWCTDFYGPILLSSGFTQQHYSNWVSGHVCVPEYDCGFLSLPCADPAENIKEILRHVVLQQGVSKGKKLAYLNSFVKLLHRQGDDRALGLGSIEILAW